MGLYRYLVHGYTKWYMSKLKSPCPCLCHRVQYTFSTVHIQQIVEWRAFTRPSLLPIILGWTTSPSKNMHNHYASCCLCPISPSPPPPPRDVQWSSWTSYIWSSQSSGGTGQARHVGRYAKKVLMSFANINNIRWIMYRGHKWVPI